MIFVRQNDILLRHSWNCWFLFTRRWLIFLNWNFPICIFTRRNHFCIITDLFLDLWYWLLRRWVLNDFFLCWFDNIWSLNYLYSLGLLRILILLIGFYFLILLLYFLLQFELLNVLSNLFFSLKMYLFFGLACWLLGAFCNPFTNTYQPRLWAILSKIQEWGCT